MQKKEITVIIIDNSNKAALKRTISSLKKQSYKNYKILIEGKTKNPKFRTKKIIAEALGMKVEEVFPEN